MGLHGWSRDVKCAPNGGRSTRNRPPAQDTSAAQWPGDQDMAEVMLLLHYWTEAVRKGDSHQLASLYCRDGALVSASHEVSNADATMPNHRAACLSHSLTALTSLGATPSILSSSIQFLGPIVAICTGTYSLHIPPQRAPTDPPASDALRLQPSTPPQSHPRLALHRPTAGGTEGALLHPAAPQPRFGGGGHSSSGSGSGSGGSSSRPRMRMPEDWGSSSSSMPRAWRVEEEQEGSWERESDWEDAAGAAAGQGTGTGEGWVGTGQASAGWEYGGGEVVEAGFLFVYCKVGGRWLIAEHHSRELEATDAVEQQGSAPGIGAMPRVLAAGRAASALQH